MFMLVCSCKLLIEMNAKLISKSVMFLSLCEEDSYPPQKHSGFRTARLP